MRPNVKRRELRDTINAVAAVGTLLVGAGTLLTTCSVTKLEDYFHSEVARKNLDYKTAAERAASLETREDSARKILDSLQLQIASLASNTARQQSSYDGAVEQLAQARTDLDKVKSKSIELELQDKILHDKAESARLESSTLIADAKRESSQLASVAKTLSKRVVPLMISSHLENVHPTLEEENSSIVYTVSFDAQDQNFRNDSGPGLGAFIFTNDDANDLAKDKVSTSTLCHVEDKYLLEIKMLIDPSTNMKSSIGHKGDALYDAMCNVFDDKITVYKLGDKKQTPYNIAGIESLRRGSEGDPIITLAPDEFAGIDVEEFRIHYFWNLALASWFIEPSKMNRILSEIEKTLPSAFDKGGVASFSLGQAIQDVIPKFETGGPVSGSSELDKEIKDFLENWAAYVKGTSIYVSGNFKV